MDEISTLLNLPFDVFAILSVGYMAYRVAYTGKDGSHQTVDVVFLTLVFSFIAKVSISLITAFSPAPRTDVLSVLTAFGGITVALAVAALWRRWGEQLVFRVLRKLSISASDRHETVWQSMLARPVKLGPARLFVRCNDGTRLLCEKLSDFKDAAYGPCLFGQDGSIALYVTDRRSSNDETWASESPKHSDTSWGYELTFIPASQIAEVSISFPASPSASAVAVSSVAKV